MSIKEKEYTVEGMRTALDRAVRLLRVEEYDTNVRIREGWIGTPMASYHVEKKEILVSINSLIRAHEDFDLPIDSLITSILAHEIGHHIHSQTSCGEEMIRAWRSVNSRNHKLERRALIEIEKKAWEYGNSVIPSEMREEFDYVNKMNLIYYSHWKSSDDRKKSTRALKERYGIRSSKDNNKN